MNTESKAGRLRRHKAYAAARDSELNLKLNALVAKLQAAAEAAQELLDDGHFHGCACPFCSAKAITLKPSIEDDLRGIAWSVALAAGSLDSLILPTSDEIAKHEVELLAEMEAQR